MPVRFSDIALPLLAGGAAAAGGEHAARPIRKVMNYAQDARSLKAQHERNMDDWENIYEENGRNQQALDFFKSFDPGNNPYYQAAKDAAGRGDLESARQFYGKGVDYGAKSMSDVMPTPEQMNETEKTLGTSDTATWHAGNQTITRRKEQPPPPPDPYADLIYRTDTDASGTYMTVFSKSRNALIHKVQIGGPNKIEKPEEEKRPTSAQYRYLLALRGLGDTTGDETIDAMSPEDAADRAAVLEMMGSQPEVGLQLATKYRAKRGLGAAQGVGGATPPGPAPENAAYPPPGLVSAHQGAASTSAPGVEEKVVAGRRIRRAGPGKWVPVD